MACIVIGQIVDHMVCKLLGGRGFGLKNDKRLCVVIRVSIAAIGQLLLFLSNISKSRRVWSSNASISLTGLVFEFVVAPLSVTSVGPSLQTGSEI